MIEVGDRAGDQRRGLVFACDPAREVPDQIRHRLREVFREWRLGSDVADDALLVVQELVINVVDHARTRFQLLVHLAGGLLRVEVHDDVPGEVRAAASEPVQLRGHGLQIVEGMSDRWGCRADGSGKTVWAELGARAGAGLDRLESPAS